LDAKNILFIQFYNLLQTLVNMKADVAVRVVRTYWARDADVAVQRGTDVLDT
jgi:hypothetical protein